LLACLALEPVPSPAAEVARRSCSVAAGAVEPVDIGRTLWLRGSLRHGIGPLLVEPEIGYWSRSELAFGLTASVRDAQLGLNIAYPLPLPGRSVGLVAAAGAAAHRIRSAGGPVGQKVASETVVRPGLQGALSLELKLSRRTAAFVAARADWIFQGGEAPWERQEKLYGGVSVGF
jgi:hypothetical protein